MLRYEDNERLVRVGPNTPAGNLFRRYWQPALLSSELKEIDGVPVRVRLLGEDLVAFRDSLGRVGLVGAYCPHRGAPLFYGRNEKCGLTCVYHGWKFDVEGKCIEQPTELDPHIKDNIKAKAYPVHESGGIIWAYMGPAKDKPKPPEYEWMRALETHRFVSRGEQESNYLQALEGGLDTAHVSFLHNDRYDDPNQLVVRDAAPRLEVYPTDYGYYYTSTRSYDDNLQFVRIYQYVMPFQQMRPNLLNLFGHGEKETIPTLRGHLWVPIDDEHTNVYNWMYAYDSSTPFTKEYIQNEEIKYGHGSDEYIPGTFKFKRNVSNDHLIDRVAQKNGSATGIFGVNAQDRALQEGMGQIVDRTYEHLGTSDKAIIMMRRLLNEAISSVEQGSAPKGVDPDLHSVRAYEILIEKNKNWLDIIGDELKEKW